MTLKSFWTSHLQGMLKLEQLHFLELKGIHTKRCRWNSPKPLYLPTFLLFFDALFTPNDSLYSDLEKTNKLTGIYLSSECNTVLKEKAWASYHISTNSFRGNYSFLNLSLNLNLLAIFTPVAIKVYLGIFVISCV